jgi:hypothetical protein
MRWWQSSRLFYYIAESPELSQRCLARNVRCLWSSCDRVWTYCGFLCRSSCQRILFWCRCAHQLVHIQDSLQLFKIHVKQSLECLTALLKMGWHATTSADRTKTSASQSFSACLPTLPFHAVLSYVHQFRWFSPEYLRFFGAGIRSERLCIDKKIQERKVQRPALKLIWKLEQTEDLIGIGMIQSHMTSLSVWTRYRLFHSYEHEPR